MITIIYDADNGIPFRDGDCERYCAALLELDKDIELTVATENIVSCMCVAILRKRVAVGDIRFVFRAENTEDLKISVDETGTLLVGPTN